MGWYLGERSETVQTHAGAYLRRSGLQLNLLPPFPLWGATLRGSCPSFVLPASAWEGMLRVDGLPTPGPKPLGTRGLWGGWEQQCSPC